MLRGVTKGGDLGMFMIRSEGVTNDAVIGCSLVSPLCSPLFLLSTMDTELYIQIPGGWVPILSIPTNEFDKYTLRPLKWLCFLGFIIYGREGVTPTSPQWSRSVDNYDIETPQLLDRYYFFSTGK